MICLPLPYQLRRVRLYRLRRLRQGPARARHEDESLRARRGRGRGADRGAARCGGRGRGGKDRRRAVRRHLRGHERQGRLPRKIILILSSLS